LAAGQRSKSPAQCYLPIKSSREGRLGSG